MSKPRLESGLSQVVFFGGRVPLAVTPESKAIALLAFFDIAINMIRARTSSVALFLELESQLRGKLGILAKSLFRKAVGVDSEVLRLLLEVLRVENKGATTVLHFLAHGFHTLVRHEILLSLVDHNFLRADLLERLDSSPLEWVALSSRTVFIFEAAAGRRALLSVGDPLDR